MDRFTKLLLIIVLAGMLMGWVGQGAMMYVGANSMWDNNQGEDIPECSAKNRSAILPTSGLGACVNARFEDTIERANRGEMPVLGAGDGDEPAEEPSLE